MTGALWLVIQFMSFGCIKKLIYYFLAYRKVLNGVTTLKYTVIYYCLTISDLCDMDLHLLCDVVIWYSGSMHFMGRVCI